MHKSIFAIYRPNLGDSTVNGVTISIVDGHLPPTGEVFVSPSIRYCTCEKDGWGVYAKSKK